MKISERIEQMLLPVITRKDNPIHQSRVRILFYSLSISTLIIGIITLFLVGQNAPVLLSRMAASLLIFAAALVYLWKTSDWIRVAHACMITVSMHVWMDVFSDATEINL